MKYLYDAEHDSLTIKLSDDRSSAATDEVWPGVLIDFDSDQQPTSIEFIDSAQRFVDVRGLESGRWMRVGSMSRLAAAPAKMTGRTLRVTRELLGLTQEELGDALAVAKNTIARWEREEMKIENPRMLALALEALGSSAEGTTGKRAPSPRDVRSGRSGGFAGKTARSKLAGTRSPMTVNKTGTTKRPSTASSRTRAAKKR
jgi:transcriptional regulator with XRE-family HTH domain